MVATSSLLFVSTMSHANPEGADLFKAKCAMCHHVGKGRLVGPDLAGVGDRRDEAWLIGFIKSAQKMVNDGDAEAKKLVDEYQMVMPNQDVTDAQSKAILAYIAGAGGAAGDTAGGTAEESAAPTEYTPETIAYGRDLFQGTARFEKGGAACNSCHNVSGEDVFGGGSLAKDLTDVHGNMGEAGIKGILAGLPFPAMKASYADRGFTDNEVTALVGFLKDVSAQAKGEVKASYGPKLAIAGLVGFIIFVILFSVIWSGRKKESVNKELFDRQISSM